MGLSKYKFGMLRVFFSILFLFGGQAAMAAPKIPSTLKNPLALALLSVIAALAIAIVLIANIVNKAVAKSRENLQQAKKEGRDIGSVPPLVLLVVGILGTSIAHAQSNAADATAAVVDTSINGLSPLTFYLLITIIFIEIIIVTALVFQLKSLMGIYSVPKPLGTQDKGERASWWWRLNKAMPTDQEEDTHHEYDGIRELNNRIPPWWNWTFAFTILFAIVYMYRYHVAHSAPLSAEEYEISVRKADAEKAAYLAANASSGSTIDENNVTMQDADGIAKGKAIFSQSCIACHGVAGEGNTVGPNLTDEYWLHGGSIKDVFKTITYGVPEKGMISWKSNFSPQQIAELASYIKSIGGSNPPNAKAPQGIPYKELATDSTKVETTKP